MCLVFFCYNNHPEYELVVAANRDEFYRRPAVPAAFWQSHPQVLAGRDIKAGGTWLGMSKSKRVAFLTCYREPSTDDSLPSRGELVENFLADEQSAHAYLENIATKTYNGYNLIVSDGQKLCYYSNRKENIEELKPGLYGLSNHLLDTLWPKVKNGKEMFRSIISARVSKQKMIAALFTMLLDGRRPPNEMLPNTGVGIEKERFLSPIFIAGRDYGTRVSTVICIDNSGAVVFQERTYLKYGQPGETVEYEFGL